MEPKSLNDLHANPKNPRKMSVHDAGALEVSLQTFGDLSSIVFNVRTQQLVGGHQRINIMKRAMPGATIQMLQPYPTEPDDVGTVGLGFITIGTKRFPYREVDWDKNFESAANIAANRIQGDFDIDLLAELDYELSQLENGTELLKQSGQTESEVNRLLKSVGAIDEPGADDQGETDKPEKLEFSLTRDQRLIVERTIEYIKAHNDLQAIESASLNGSALFVVCKEYIERHESATTTNPPIEATEQNVAQTPAHPQTEAITAEPGMVEAQTPTA